MDSLTQSMANFLGQGAAKVAGFFLAVIVIILGWFFAKIASKVVRQLLITADFDQRLGRWMGLEGLGGEGEKPKRRLAQIVEMVVYWILLLVFVIFALELLGDVAVTSVLREILTKIGLAVPNILKALLILAGAWILAIIAKFAAIKGMRKIQLGERWGKVLEEAQAPKPEGADVIDSFGNFIFYFILLLALLPFFEALQLQALVDPLKSMLTKVLDFIPNLITAALVLVIGYFLARLCERLVTNFALSAGVNRWVEGMRYETVLKSLNVARILGTVVFIALMVPVLGIAFQVLDLPVITGVFATMMNEVASSIPLFAGAFLILVLGFIAGRYLGDLVGEVLSDIGFDVILGRLGLERLESRDEKTGKPSFSLSAVAGNLVAAVVILFFTMEAFRMVHMVLVADAIDRLILFVPNVLVAFLILGLGFYLARVVEQLANRSFAGDSTVAADVVGLVLRYAIIVFAFFMAFDELKIAHSIVVNAFTVLLGAVGLGLALAFGLGAKEQAGSYVRSLTEHKAQRAKAAKHPPKEAHREEPDEPVPEKPRE
jgi:hypothetical protein